MEEQDMGFSCSDAAVKEIVRNGFDPVFGARPLRRAIQKLVENPISSLIIEKKMSAGNQVAVDFDGQNFVFNLDKVENQGGGTVKNPVKKYVCEVCANRFETEIVPNSTLVCSKCASSKLQELYEDTENTPPVKPEPEIPAQVQDPSLQPSKNNI